MIIQVYVCIAASMVPALERALEKRLPGEPWQGMIQHGVGQRLTVDGFVEVPDPYPRAAMIRWQGQETLANKILTALTAAYPGLVWGRGRTLGLEDDVPELGPDEEPIDGIPLRESEARVYARWAAQHPG